MRPVTGNNKYLLAAAVALAAVWVSWAVFHHECAAGGAMGGWYMECSCRGAEYTDYDHTAADGPLRTICLGVVTKRTCYRGRGGPEMLCAEVVR